MNPKHLVNPYLVLLPFLLCSMLQVVWMEHDNYGFLSGLYTLIFTVPVALAWLFSGISAVIFTRSQPKKAARIIAYLLLAVSIGGMILVGIATLQSSLLKDQLTAILPLSGSLSVLFLPAVLRKRNKAG